jgi:protein subunit release factor B
VSIEVLQLATEAAQKAKTCDDLRMAQAVVVPGLLKVPEQKELIQSRLATRIGKNGVLRVISQQTRSQTENKELAIERFAELLRDAVKQVPIRKKTRVSKAAKLRRLEEKRSHSFVKRGRSKPSMGD